jgi:GNAT superfamily N-acetyltransferase
VPGAVRRAAPGDAAAIVEIRRAAWLEAYSPFLSVTFPREPADEAQVWRDTLGEHAVWVTGAPDGFASVDGCELTTLYVHPRSWGAGLGGALHDVAVAHLRSHGCRSATLWVFEANARARRFYEARGWLPDPGVVEEGDADWPVRALRYRLDLT